MNVQHLEEVLNRIGRYGSYQKRQIALSIAATLPYSFHIVSSIFIGIVPDHTCSVYSNGSFPHHGNKELVNTSYGKCSITWQYDNDSYTEETGCLYGNAISKSKKFSFVSEWDLFCDRQVLATLSQSLILAGMFLGALSSPLADKFGRKTVHIISNIGLFATSLAMTFVKDFSWFLALRFFIGMFQQGMLLAVTSLWLELSHRKHRMLIGSMIGILWCVGVLILALVAFLLQDYGWRYIQFTLTLFSTLSFLEIFFLDESLRWLCVNNKFEKVKTILRTAAKLNAAPLTEDDINMLSQERKTSRDMTCDVSDNLDSKGPSNYDNKKMETQQKWTALLVNPTLRKHSLIMWTCWIVNNLTYYGVILMSSALSGNLYINFVLGTVAEIVSSLSLILSLNKLERKTAMIMYQCITGAGFIITIITSNFSGKALRYIETAIYLICRGSIVGSFNGIYLLTPELFPTNLRNSGLGMASSAGRISSMVAPFAAYTLAVGLWLPSLLFGSICLLSAFLLYFIPGTRRRQLPQTMEEIELWVHHKDKS